jgi:hypothetical protein
MIYAYRQFNYFPYDSGTVPVHDGHDYNFIGTYASFIVGLPAWFH